MQFGNTLTQLRKQRGWSQNDLAQKIMVSRVIVGRYERDEALPSIEVAKRIADVFEVSLDRLVGDGQYSEFDKRTLLRLRELEQLDESKKLTLFDLIDTYIRDAKARKAYAM